MRVGLEAFLLLSAVLFSIGVYGAVSKRSAVQVIMSLELISIAVMVNMVAFARFVTPDRGTGWAFTLFAMVVSAAEVGVGLALVLAIYRRRHTAELPELDELKG
ncbi:MAG: NADH-quinone oxidoreductase subunit NuoK [Coriobacteriales bacterium]|nr:NADH-quinone oxidoreductase subunit NuoK [Coriobacteriales bacterium]